MDGTNWLVGIIDNPFAKGLSLGIIFCIFVYFRSFLRRYELTKEIDRLRSHLHTKLEIDAAEPFAAIKSQPPPFMMRILTLVGPASWVSYWPAMVAIVVALAARMA